MKYRLFIGVLTVCMIFLMSCKKDNSLLITGELTNINTPYILSSYLVNDSVIIDTIATKDNKFNFKKSIDSLTTFTLYFNNYRTSVVFFADKDEKISLSGDADYPDLINITGNSINNELSEFKKENKEALIQRAKLLLDIREQGDLPSDSISTQIAKHKTESMLNSLNHELMIKVDDYIQENPTKASSLVLINNFLVNTEEYERLERALGHLHGEILKAPMAVTLQSYLNKIKKSSEDKYLPTFELKDKNGKKIKSSELKGKYIVLSFVSSEGEESRQNLRILRNEYKNIKKDSTRFISIYIDADKYPVNYPSKDSIPWTIVTEKNSWASNIVEDLNIPTVPYNILINPQGIIQLRNMPAQNLSSIIKNNVKKEK